MRATVNVRNLGAAVLTVAVLVGAAGCGGGRPSVDDVSKSLQKSADGAMGNTTLDKKQADCAAKAFVDSKLSDEALQALVDGDKKYKGSSDDKKALTSVMGEASKCLTKQ